MKTTALNVGATYTINLQTSFIKATYTGMRNTNGGFAWSFRAEDRDSMCNIRKGDTFLIPYDATGLQVVI